MRIVRSIEQLTVEGSQIPVLGERGMTGEWARVQSSDYFIAQSERQTECHWRAISCGVGEKWARPASCLAPSATLAFSLGKPRGVKPDPAFQPRWATHPKVLRLTQPSRLVFILKTAVAAGNSAENAGFVSLSPSFVGQSFVHSPLVTLGNHTILDSRSYNWPCP